MKTPQSVAMLAAVVKKEVRQTVRDRRMMMLLVAAPAVQLFLFGHAVNLEVDDVPTAVVDLDRSETSRRHVRRMAADGTLQVTTRVASVEEAQHLLDVGAVAVAVVIPQDYESSIRRRRPTEIQVIVDGSDPNRTNVAQSAIARYVTNESQAISLARTQGVGARPTRTYSRIAFNPQLKSAIYMVPGIAALLLMMISTIVTAMGLARERERGTLEQILVTPVRPSILITGKILPFAAVGLFDLALALVVGAYVFDMPMVGPLWLLFGGSVLYLLATLGVGLAISTIASSQQQAFMIGFLFMLPAALLSGILTPIRSMPGWLQHLTLINPLRHFQEIARGVLLRGAGPSECAGQLLALAVMGIVIFALAVYRFRRAS